MYVTQASMYVTQASMYVTQASMYVTQASMHVTQASMYIGWYKSDSKAKLKFGANTVLLSYMS